MRKTFLRLGIYRDKESISRQVNVNSRFFLSPLGTARCYERIILGYLISKQTDKR